MNFIAPIHSQFFLRIQGEKNCDLGQTFRFLQKVIFSDFITPITPKFRGENDFYSTNQSKIYEIRI